MEFCKKCNNTGSTTDAGFMDCAAPGCNAAADRVAFDKWLLREGYGQSGIKEWAIYRHAVRTAVESCSMLLDENERLRAALAQSQASYGALAMELAAAKVSQDALVMQMKEIAKYDSSEGYAAMRALTAAGVTL